MTTNSEELTPQTLEERIIAKAIEDPAYKQRLLSDAKAVLQEELDASLPDDLTVQVLQQSPKHLYLLLPMDIDELVRNSTLFEAELEAVAGGSLVQIGTYLATVLSTDYAYKKATPYISVVYRS
ncbi:NHLP leader peptide family RiPP precursor [Cylindrospermum sp. FACHB-282]|uniref:NHLP leader peptide family RiPP precursor n=1 Tax=Cylindrospermum sp. FACHB-282 TaxID=2692794 RepID=UPI00168A1E8C|nr:NHLP leader peptide family RiPP precursor [Cylindrospermum sp. FACHB-282]MBD2387093.1 NHLP leader peptide family natural product precursor [Cylindrospermum sp. FACHB-282]